MPIFSDQHVVLLHGLFRSSMSMTKLEKALKFEGYIVWNLDYPSTKKPIEELAFEVREAVLSKTNGAVQIHFVTHSMGGIIVRQMVADAPFEKLGRVVMLGPPNQGSELTDKMRNWKSYRALNGPAGLQLGTGEDSVPNRLGPASFELAVIAGDRSINWINSRMIPGKDDGKVSLERAKLEGMTAYKVVHATHPMMMKKREVIGLTIEFLKTGKFAKE